MLMVTSVSKVKKLLHLLVTKFSARKMVDYSQIHKNLERDGDKGGYISQRKMEMNIP